MFMLSHIEVLSRNNEYILSLVGHVNLVFSQVIQQVFQELKKQGLKVDFEFSRTTLMDSTILGVFSMFSLDYVQENHSQMPLLNCPQVVKDSFNDLGIEHMFDFQVCDYSSFCAKENLECSKISVDEQRRICIDAHEALIKINLKNKDSFTQVLKALKLN